MEVWVYFRGRGEKHTDKRVLRIAGVTAVVVFLAGIYITPKWVLRNAVLTAYKQLEVRFSHHPARFIVQTLNKDGRIAAELDFCAEEPGVYPITGDASLYLDLPGRKMQTMATVESDQQKEELMLYLDQNEMVIGTDLNPESIRFGIHYDSFREDIRQVPYLSEVVAESVFEEWDRKLLNLKAVTDWNYSLPHIPSVSADSVSNLLWGLVFAPCSIERIPCSDFAPNHCCRVTYELSQERLRVCRNGADGNMRVSFLIHGNRLVQLDAAAESGEAHWQCRITFAENAEEGALRFQVEALRSGIREEGSCFVTSKVGENRYAESWAFYKDFDGKVPSSQFLYIWQPKTGDMQVFWQSEEPMSLNLKMDENRICMVSDEWQRLLSGIWHSSFVFWDQKQISGSVVLQSAGPVPVPKCIYPEEWSLEQLFQLLASLKSVADIAFD